MRSLLWKAPSLGWGGLRPGAYALYLEPWHSDIFSFLELGRVVVVEHDGLASVLVRHARVVVVVVVFVAVVVVEDAHPTRRHTRLCLFPLPLFMFRLQEPTHRAVRRAPENQYWSSQTRSCARYQLFPVKSVSGYSATSSAVSAAG